MKNQTIAAFFPFQQTPPMPSSRHAEQAPKKATLKNGKLNF